MPRPREQATCDCGWTGEIRRDTYIANIKRNGKYTCHKCATKMAGAAGKYSGSKKTRSAQSKALWQVIL